MNDLDPTDPAVWAQVRHTVARSRTSTLHCAIASINADGSPHVTPIGSVALGRPGEAYYLDVFNVSLGRNLDRDPRCEVMAVDSHLSTWLGALLGGRFTSPQGVRLIGTAGPARPATDAEVERFRRAVRPALLTRGGRALWGRSDRYRARDLAFHAVVPVRVPRMTAHLWPTATRPAPGGMARRS
jgi:hypothetical protein